MSVTARCGGNGGWGPLQVAPLVLVVVALGLLACEPEEEEVQETTTMGGVGASAEITTDPMDTEMTSEPLEPMTTEEPTPESVTTEMETEMGTDMGPPAGAQSADAAPRRSSVILYQHHDAGLYGETLRHYLFDPKLANEQQQVSRCETDCRTDDRCAGWTVIRKWEFGVGAAQCYLMSAATGWQLSPCCISGVKAGLREDDTSP